MTEYPGLAKPYIRRVIARKLHDGTWLIQDVGTNHEEVISDEAMRRSYEPAPDEERINWRASSSSFFRASDRSAIPDQEMTPLQQLQAEVEDRAQIEMLVRLIEREEAKLREVPSGLSYERHVRQTLNEYVQAKLELHWKRKRAITPGGGGDDELAMTPTREWPKLLDRWRAEMKLARTKMENARDRYYRAIGRKQKQNG